MVDETNESYYTLKDMGVKIKRGSLVALIGE